jgi:hypothetical protein
LFKHPLVYECQQACQQHPACGVFQYQRVTGYCKLKDSITGTSTFSASMITGPPECDFTKGNLKKLS